MRRFIRKVVHMRAYARNGNVGRESERDVRWYVIEVGANGTERIVDHAAKLGALKKEYPTLKVEQVSE